jgi:hypothetical protein
MTITVNIPVRVSVRINADGTREILQVLHVGGEDQPQRTDEIYEDFTEALERAVSSAPPTSVAIAEITAARGRPKKPNIVPTELWRAEREARLEWALSDLDHVELTWGVLNALKDGPKTLRQIVDHAFPGQRIANVVRAVLCVLEDNKQVVVGFEKAAPPAIYSLPNALQT